MKSMIAIALLALACVLQACGTNPTTGQTTIAGVNVPQSAKASPESQIVTGANAETAAATLALTLAKNGVITAAQVKGFSTLLHAASAALDQAHATLVTCRAATGSTPASNPDPCALGVADLISLAGASIASVKATLDKK